MELLRLLGIWNAAIWLGAAVFYVFLVEPAVYSSQLQNVLGQHADYFSGVAGQVLARRFLTLQMICGALAILHLAFEWIYFGREPKRWKAGLLGGVILLALLSGFVLQPKLRALNLRSHAVNFPIASRDSAARSFAIWRSINTGLNVMTIAGLALLFWPRSPSGVSGPRFFPANKL